MSDPIEQAPPADLGEAGLQLWARVAGEFELPRHALSVLEGACRMADRAQQAREIISREGLTTLDNRRNVKQHPAVEIERTSLAALQRSLKCINVDLVTGAE
jgi:P27 family predicted phage terminase small subunit